MVLTQQLAYMTAIDLGLVVAYCNHEGQELMRGSNNGRASRGEPTDLRVQVLSCGPNLPVVYEAQAETVDGQAFLDLVR